MSPPRLLQRSGGEASQPSMVYIIIFNTIKSNENNGIEAPPVAPLRIVTI
jgi:hypothetical protein